MVARAIVSVNDDSNRRLVASQVAKKGAPVAQRYRIGTLITRTRNGREQYIYRIHDTTTGEIVGERTSTKSKSAALDKARKRRDELEAGAIRAGEIKTVGQLLDYFFDSYNPRSAGSLTQHRHHEKMIRKRLGPGFALDDLRDSTPAAHGLTRGQVQTLRTAINAAIRDKILTHNPVATSRVPVAHKDKEAYSIPELRKIFEVFAQRDAEATTPLQQQLHRDDHTRYLISATTGMRIGELLAIEHGTLLHDDHTWYIDRQVYTQKPGTVPAPHQMIEHLGGQTYLTRPKTESSIRTVPIPHAICEAIPREDTRFLFRSFRHPYMSTKTASDRWMSAVRASGVRPRSLHVLRSSFLSIAIGDLGLPYTTAKAVVGHAKREVTEKYITIRPEQKREMVEAVYNAINIQPLPESP